MRKIVTSIMLVAALLLAAFAVAAPSVGAHGGQQFWYHCAASSYAHDSNTLHANVSELSGGHVNSCTAGFTMQCAKYLGGGYYSYQYKYKTVTDSSGGNGAATGHKDCSSGYQYFNSWIGWVDTN